MGVFTVTIKKGEEKIDPTFLLVKVDVIHEINKIPLAELVFVDGDASNREFIISNSNFFLPGSEIEVLIRYEENAETEHTLFKGIVVKQSVEADAYQSTIQITLKDKAVAMTRTKRNNVYRNLTDTDIIGSIFQEYGITVVPGNESSNLIHQELVQYYSTDWDFVLSRLEANGLWLYLNQGTFSVILPANIKLGDEEEQENENEQEEEGEQENEDITIYRFAFGLDPISNFHLELDAESQFGVVNSVGWDLASLGITSEAEAKTFENLPTDQVGSEVGLDDFQLQSQVPLDNEELTAWSNAKLQKSRFAFVRGSFSIQGIPQIKPLEIIEIDGISDRFKGRAIITAVRHRISEEGWFTDVQFGLSDQWFVENHAINALPAAGLLPAIQNLQVGIVETFDDDPRSQFRIQVRIPAFGEEAGPVWARLASPEAGNNRGYFFRPEPGDEVVLGFFNSDPRQPVILGSMYSQSNPIPDAVGGLTEDNFIKGIFSREGVELKIDDEKRQLQLLTSDSQSITLDEDGKLIEIVDVNGNTITLNDQGISLKSAKDVIIEASNNITIKGKKVDVQ